MQIIVAKIMFSKIALNYKIDCNKMKKNQSIFTLIWKILYLNNKMVFAPKYLDYTLAWCQHKLYIKIIVFKYKFYFLSRI